MARGFVSGALWGGVLSVVVAGLASVIAPPPPRPEVSDAAPGAVAVPDVSEAPTAETETSMQDSAAAPGASAPQAPAPDPDTLTALDEETTSTAAAPQTGEATDLATPTAPVTESAPAPQAEEPVLQNPLALAPMEPQPADELSISTEPAQPPQPEPAPEESAFGTAGIEDTPAPAEEAEASVDAAEEATEAAAAATEDAAQAAREATDAAAEAAETATEAATVPPVQTSALETSEENAAPANGDSTIAAEPAAPVVAERPPSPAEAPTIAPPATADAAGDEEADAPEVAMVAPAGRPQIGTPAGTLTDRDTGVVVNRLSIGTAEDTTPVAETSTAATALDADLPPVDRFAQPFENPEAKPLMSVILIDDGSKPTSGAAGVAALRSFPYTLSFAVDSSLPDAAERMALYRAEGFEVLAMIDLPDGARPTDAETTLSVILDRMDEVVGVLEGPGTGLQGSREVSDQVNAILAQTGHGLVTQNRGLNTMPNLARKEGVPAAAIFRDFDSKDQSATVIRRFLDQAAFKAGQEGAVIMLGRLRPDTISALLLWGLQDRAGSVAIAPVTAVLTREEGS
ncbi:divergent polysaccharide deacetylase family protein [Marimonas sp. MJW-29]|uniref:Divergent polysaccharide deacetylase family protein n=1 Tax=Sulfitobacter sediminis TaxID=3234186 RepID=A0ABV3RNZ0_9RHOB